MAEPTPSLPLIADPIALGLSAHPEGGWYRETWRHVEIVDTVRGPRPLATAINFMLLPGETSAWHRVASDELWLWQGGGTIRLMLGGSAAPRVGGGGEGPGVGGHFLVPAGVGQRAEPASPHAVMV